MKLFIPLLLCFLLSLFLSCEKWDLEPQDFIEVEIRSVEALSIDSVRIRGEVKDHKSLLADVKSYGILWSTASGPLTIESFEGNQRLGALNENNADGLFETVLRMEPNRDYFLVAYATVDNERYFYSETESYMTGNGKVFTDGLSYESGFSFIAQGHVSGTEKGLSVVQHGFCWSSTNSNPGFSDDTIQLGSRQNNEPFSFSIPYDSALNGSPYYVRSYAIFKNSVAESPPVFGEVQTFDGNLNFWTEKASYPGKGRKAAIGFVIDSLAYLGMGWDDGPVYRDLWAYNPEDNTWTQRASSGSVPVAGVGFAINGKGYLGMGNGFSGGPGFWEYDPETNVWTAKADYPGRRAWAGVGFAIGNKGYFGLGQRATGFFNMKDFWEYDPSDTTNGFDVNGAPMGKWTRKADFSGTARAEASGFSIGNKGYIGLGNFTDFYEYDPEFDRWTEKASFAGVPRRFAVGFDHLGMGYFGTGIDARNSARLKDFWKYDPLDTSLGLDKNGNPLGKWFKVADLPNTAHDGLGFSIGRKAYVGVGADSLSVSQQRFWEFDP